MSTSTTETTGLAGGARVGIAALGAVAIVQNIDAGANSIAVVPAANDLSMSTAEYGLAASLSTLFLAATILAGGAVGDRLGRKKIMQLGVLTAGVGAVIAALAPVTPILLLGRSITGIGVGFSFGLSFALVRSTAPHAIPKGVALWITVQMAGLAISSVAIGALVDVSWRLGYGLIGAIALIALLAVSGAGKNIPEAKADEVGKFDTVGLVSVGLGMVLLILGISRISTDGLGSPTVLGALGVALLLLVFFVWWEARLDDPALPVRVFKDKELGASIASIFSYNMWQAVVTLMMVMFLTYLALYGSFQIALAQLPMLVTFVIGATITGNLLGKGMSQHTGILVGHGLMILATAWMFLATREAGFLFFLVPLLIGGFGRIMAETSLAPYFVTKPPPNLTGSVGSSKTSIGQTAFAMGTALSTAILFVGFGNKFRAALAEENLSDEAVDDVVNIVEQYAATGEAEGEITVDGVVVAVSDVIERVSDVYVDAFKGVFIAIILVQVVLAVVTWLLLRSAKKDQAAAAEGAAPGGQ
jgi:MFS family permease